MKCKHFSLFVPLIFLSFLIHAQQLIVGTFNIRYDSRYDSGNLWENRAPVVANLIRFHDFDIFGTQEGLINQLEDISKALPQYARYGVGRTDGKIKGEHAAVYFKKDRFKLLKKGDFWLSQTPDTPSRGWDGKCCNRICSWVQLKDKQKKKKFYFFNVHFDHEAVVARRESSKLILQKIKEIAGDERVILTGDLNGDSTTEWYQTLATSGVLKDTYKEVAYPYANSSSFNAFGAANNRTDNIDHIFTTHHFTALKWGILTDTYHGKYPSDHFPVMAVIKYK